MTRAGESGLISLRTVHLVEEAIKTMFVTRIRIGVAVALLAGCLAAGAAGVFAQQGSGQETGREPKSSSSDTAQAVAASRELAPPYIRQSRKMIVERLEQELALARERLDRTTRRVRSSTDPELLRARKTADTLAGLMARIDAVLVETVDEFPTMFDFTNAEAIGASGLKAKNIKRDGWTDVVGAPDVDLVVSEPKRVLDVGGMTTFQIRLRNHGTKEAINLQVKAILSPNLEFQEAEGGSKGLEVAYSLQKHAVVMDRINKLGSGNEMVIGIVVKVVGETPKLATCKVFITHEGLSGWFDDMAGVKVTAGRQSPARTDAAHADPTAAADDSARPTTAPDPKKPDDVSAGPAYDEHSLAKAAEKLEWSRKMHEKGYVSKGQYEQDLATHEALKARIDADIARAAERVEWAKKMFEKGYVSKSQYQAEILKHYDALQARLEGQSQAVSDDLLKRYELLKSKLQERGKNK